MSHDESRSKQDIEEAGAAVVEEAAHFPFQAAPDHHRESEAFFERETTSWPLARQAPA